MTRRIKRSRSASGDGASFSTSSRARTNRSISFTGQCLFFTRGGAGGVIGLKAQCRPHFAPPSIHRLTSSICFTVSLWFDSGGGIRSSGSLVMIRLNNSLSALLPGTITVFPSLTRNAPSLVSSRNFALRAFSSGPWHLKQLSEKIGRTSRLKSASPLVGESRPTAAGANPGAFATSRRLVRHRSHQTTRPRPPTDALK